MLLSLPKVIVANPSVEDNNNNNNRRLVTLAERGRCYCIFTCLRQCIYLHICNYRAVLGLCHRCQRLVLACATGALLACVACAGLCHRCQRLVLACVACAGLCHQCLRLVLACEACAGLCGWSACCAYEICAADTISK